MTASLPSTKLNLDDLLAQIVERAQDVIPFDGGGIAIYDVETRLLAPHTYHRATPDAPMPRLLALGQGIVGTVAQTRQAILIDDVRLDERYLAGDAEMRSELTVP